MNNECTRAAWLQTEEDKRTTDHTDITDGRRGEDGERIRESAPKNTATNAEVKREWWVGMHVLSRLPLIHPGQFGISYLSVFLVFSVVNIGLVIAIQFVLSEKTELPNPGSG